MSFPSCDYANQNDTTLVNYHFDADSMTVISATDQRVADFVAGGGVIGAYDPSIASAIVAARATAAAEVTRKAGLSADANVLALLTQAKTATNAQLDTWLTNNVTNLAQARTVLGALIKFVAVKLI